MDYKALIDTFGWPIGTMMIAIVMLYTDMIVSGRRYREVCRQRDRLLSLALKGQGKAFAATGIAEALVRQAGDDDAVAG